MRILVMGGTSFLGRAVVEAALERGDSVTTFNRGRTAPDLPGVEALRGDRSAPADLETLRGREYDAVVDTCGYVPRVVGEAARLLEPTVGRYAFVSSVSVYSRWPAEPADERAPVFACEADAGADDGHYGELKAGCERAVAEAFGPERSLILRPGVILGPRENVGRLPWWLLRTARGGDVLAPGDPATPIQTVDARDLAAFTLSALDSGLRGPFNVTGPEGMTTYGRWLQDCVDVTGADARLVWVDDAALLERGVTPWTELPLWLPMSDPDSRFGWSVDVSRAAGAGLTCRPARQTVEDTWAWLRSTGLVPNGEVDAEGRIRGHGIAAEKEAAVLAAVSAR